MRIQNEFWAVENFSVFSSNDKESGRVENANDGKFQKPKLR